LLGGISTASARFGFLNVNSGTPTASLSAAGNNATYLSATGVLGTTNAQTLNIGGSTTGNIILNAGSGSITLGNNTTLLGNLTATDGNVVDLSGIVHTAGVNEGLILPQSTLGPGFGPSTGVGYLAYDPTGSGIVKFWNGTQWVSLASTAAGASQWEIDLGILNQLIVPTTLRLVVTPSVLLTWC